MAKKLVYITYKSQQWTFDSKDNLTPLLEGKDDYVMEFAVPDEHFAIILKNGRTFKVKDNLSEAEEYIKQIYRNYKIVENEDENQYISREDPSLRFATSGLAQQAGIYDYLFVPTHAYFVTRQDKVLFTAPTYEIAQQKIYDHFGAIYTYIC